MARKLGRAATS